VLAATRPPYPTAKTSSTTLAKPARSSLPVSCLRRRCRQSIWLASVLRLCHRWPRRSPRRLRASFSSPPVAPRPRPAFPASSSPPQPPLLLTWSSQRRMESISSSFRVRQCSLAPFPPSSYPTTRARLPSTLSGARSWSWLARTRPSPRARKFAGRRRSCLPRRFYPPPP